MQCNYQELFAVLQTIQQINANIIYKRKKMDTHSGFTQLIQLFIMTFEIIKRTSTQKP